MIGLVNLCIQRGSAVAGVAEAAGSSNRGDLAGRVVDFLDASTSTGCNKVSRRIQREAVGIAEHGLGGRNVLAVVSADTGTGISGDVPGGIDFADSIAVEIADVEIAGTVVNRRSGSAHGGIDSWAFVAYVSAGDREDFRGTHHAHPRRRL